MDDDAATTALAALTRARREVRQLQSAHRRGFRHARSDAAREAQADILTALRMIRDDIHTAADAIRYR